MSVKLRFAPSPTGFIHVGNIRTALMNALLARKMGGTFLLRLDDTDAERSTEEFAEAIKQDLTWLGLHYDDHVKQSDRMARYDAVRDALIASGRLYPCYETPEELERKRKRQMAKGKPPVYDRAALTLTHEEKTALENEGRKPHFRFKLNLTDILFKDMIRGDVKIDATSVSDPVLVRADGTYLYTLCSVIDDCDYNITHIIRGEDHVTNTAVQIQIFEALGAEIPLFGHHPLLTDDKGEKLSKRIGGLSVRGLREAGIEPQTILSYLARIGTSDPVEAHITLDDLVAGFDIARTSHSAARFSAQDMEHLNGNILSLYPYEQIETRLKTLVPNANKDFWHGIRHNLKLFSDVSLWNDIIFGNPELLVDEDDKDFIKMALEILPDDAWDDTIWTKWTNALKDKTGRKGKNLFMPLRKALTGMEHGPEMAVVTRLLGRYKVMERLSGVV